MMNTYIGIDLGTSGVKILLVGADGKIINEVGENYPVLYPKSGWTEQNPSDWVEAVSRGMARLLDEKDKAAVKGISFGGQMHGLVALDKNNHVIRPCILWNDGRTEKQTKYLNEVVGQEKLSAYTGNIAFAGFTAPKLLWLKENEPQNFEQIAKIMLPKDYLAYILSGAFCTDYSDASGTLLLDVQHKCWSKEMCEICGVKKEWLPRLYESYEVVGTIKRDWASEFGLSTDVRVIAGAGDNAAAAIGTGTVDDGDCNVSLGTSGTVFISADNFSVDGNNALHSFCHANGKWHLMGCILSAASARKWWLEDILGTKNYKSDNKLVKSAGQNKIFFLPYLMGERCPHNDVNARGAFIGLSAQTTRADMSKAVMEGVVFALKDCLDYSAVIPSTVTVCGGGAKSNEWKQLIADIFSVPVKTVLTEQGPAYGAAMLAMVGCGEYISVKQAARSLVTAKKFFAPNMDNVNYYIQKFSTYKKLYSVLSIIKQ